MHDYSNHYIGTGNMMDSVSIQDYSTVTIQFMESVKVEFALCCILFSHTQIEISVITDNSIYDTVLSNINLRVTLNANLNF